MHLIKTSRINTQSTYDITTLSLDIFGNNHLHLIYYTHTVNEVPVNYK